MNLKFGIGFFFTHSLNIDDDDDGGEGCGEEGNIIA
jgi:hypothetical protein